MVVDRGFDNLTLRQRLRYVGRTAQNFVAWKVEDALSAAAKALGVQHPPLTEKFLRRGDPNEPFSSEEKRNTDKDGKVTTESRVYTRSQFVAEVIGGFEERYGMSTDMFWKKYRRGQLDYDGPRVGDYVSWAGFYRVMEYSVKQKQGEGLRN